MSFRLPQLPFQNRVPRTSEDLLSDLSGLLTASTGIDPGYMAWEAQHPLAALQTGGEMQLPVGPWGGLSAGFRTGPARTIGQNMTRQKALDMWRDASHSIDKDAPTSGFLQHHVYNSMKESQLRDMGLGMRDVQRSFLNRRAGAKAYDDQDKAAWDALHSMFPDPHLTEIMDPQLQGTLRQLLLNAREQVESRLTAQQANTGKSFKGPAIPDVIDSHTKYVQNAINMFANKILKNPHEGPRGQVRESAARRLQTEARVIPQRLPGEQMNQRFGIFRHKN